MINDHRTRLTNFSYDDVNEIIYAADDKSAIEMLLAYVAGLAAVRSAKLIEFENFSVWHMKCAA